MMYVWLNQAQPGPAAVTAERAGHMIHSASGAVNASEQEKCHWRRRVFSRLLRTPAL